MNKSQYVRKDKLIKEKRRDVYESSRDKWSEPTLCTKCGALFVNGRWSWDKPAKKANEAICPACQRVVDGYPAGYVEIKGEFFKEHRDEILHLIHNIEKQEKSRHPLERIMSITDEKDHTLLKTTGIHIVRRIGEALLRSYNGDFSFQYGHGEKNIRGCWQR